VVLVLVLVVGCDAEVLEDTGVGADDDGAEGCVNTEAWAWGGLFEADEDEDADAGISSRGCKVVGGVEISGAAGGGCGGSEKALVGAKEAEAGGAGIDESVCSADDVEKVIGVGGRIDGRIGGGRTSNRCDSCNGSPSWLLGRGKLAVLHRPMLSSLDGGVMLLGTTDGHEASFTFSSHSTQSRSDSASFRSCTGVGAASGLDGGVGAELLRFSAGVGEGGRG